MNNDFFNIDRSYINQFLLIFQNLLEISLDNVINHSTINISLHQILVENKFNLRISINFNAEKENSKELY